MSNILINPTVTLNNKEFNMLGGDWKIDLKVVTTNNNAIELTITQPIDQAMEFKVVLYNTNLIGLRDFGEKISQIANHIIA